MGYNKSTEERKWKQWKMKEERILREQGMPERKILELRQYDWNLFNSDRRFREKQFTNNDFINYVGMTCIKLPIRNFSDILDQIEDIQLYDVMRKANIQTMAILYLKICGYTNKEISSMLGLKETTIRKRIYDIRKKLKK